MGQRHKELSAEFELPFQGGIIKYRRQGLSQVGQRQSRDVLFTHDSQVHLCIIALKLRHCHAELLSIVTGFYC